MNASFTPCFVLQVWCHPTRCEYERWRSLADEEALPPGERCRAARPPAAVAPLHYLQQRDDRVCDNGASTRCGDHVFVRLIVRPYCSTGGRLGYWEWSACGGGRPAPEAAMCACGWQASSCWFTPPSTRCSYVRSTARP